MGVQSAETIKDLQSDIAELSNSLAMIRANDYYSGRGKSDVAADTAALLRLKRSQLRHLRFENFLIGFKTVFEFRQHR